MNENLKQTFFIFIGKSGSGKGTQAELLIKRLKEKNPGKEVVTFGAGRYFREFAAGDGYSRDLIRKYLEKGALVPDFLTVYFWSKFFIEELKGGEDVVMDGSPRKLMEAQILDGVFEFYGGHAYIFNVYVSDDWARARLLGRGREDDKEEEIRNRLSWFETEVSPTIEFYKNHPKHTFFDINGEQTIEEVAREIQTKLDGNF